MSDAVLVLAWLFVLLLGLGFVTWVRRLGVSRTHARDLLHVGAGVWCFGWPWWRVVWIPVAITCGALLLIAAVPLVSSRVRALGRLQQAISGGDERWTGVLLYTASFALFTAIALLRGPMFPAAAALLALAIGDGIGGAAGVHFGKRRYRFPWAKPKSLEGTVVVALGAALGVSLAAAFFGGEVTLTRVLVASAIAGLIEAASPRASDNLLLPLAVWLALIV